MSVVPIVASFGSSLCLMQSPPWSPDSSTPRGAGLPTLQAPAPCRLELCILGMQSGFGPCLSATFGFPIKAQLPC